MDKIDITQLATKKDLKATEKSLRAEMLRVEKRVEDLDEKFTKKFEEVNEKIRNLEEKFFKRFDKIMTMLDGIAKVVDDLRTENTVGSYHTRELRIQVDNHEKRIKYIESTQTK